MSGDDRFLDFIEYDAGKGRTQKFRVKHIKGEELGVVKWYSPWRRYTFFPNDDTLYDENCLTEIQQFLTGLMEVRHDRQYNR